MVGDGGNISAGEIGGIFAGGVALLATLGHGIKWLLGFTSSQQARRSSKLQQWHDELDARERKIDEEQEAYRRGIEQDLTDLREWKRKVEVEQTALKTGYHLLASALRTIDPNNQALRMADELLRSAFKVDPMTPPDMLDQLTAIDRAASAAGEGGKTP